MSKHLRLFYATSVSAFLSFVVCFAARAAVTLSSPAADATVPLQQDGQKTYFAMTPRATRWAYMDSDAGRKAMINTTSRPKAVRLAWSGGTAPYTVTVRRAHDNALFVSQSTSVAYIDLYNFEIGRKYTWQVTDKNGTASSARTFTTEPDAPRFLRVGVSNTVNFTNGLERSSGKASLKANGSAFLPNFRDVGGVYTADGTKRMKQGLVYRSYEYNMYGSAYRPYGVNTDVVCGQLGVKTDLDLRSTNEVSAIVNVNNSQSPLNASAHPVEWIHCPIAKYDAALIGKHEKNALALFTSTAKLPLVFHCMCGQDRTGCLALYLYAILGVDDETMLKSWEASCFFQGDNNWSESDPGFRSYRIQGFIDSFRAYGTASDSLATCVVKALKAKNIVTDANIASIRATLLETDPDAGGSDTPTGAYQSLHETLITDGVGYIDTGYTPNLATTKVELKFRQLTPSNGKGIGGYFSAGNDLYLQRWNSYNVGFGYHGAQTQWLATSMSDTTSDYVVWTQGRTSGFGTKTLTATNAQVTANASATLKLFRGIYEYPSESGTYAGVPVQLYYCKIYENGTLVRDYVPAKSPTGVATLYDNKTGTCLTPTSAAGFTLGAKTSEGGGGSDTPVVSTKTGFARAAEENRPPRVLVIGNSFTQGLSRDVQYKSDGTTVKETRTHFPTAVRAMGEQIDYCALYRGGSTIQQHYEGRATRGFFAEIDWSFDSAAPSWSTAKKGMLWLDEDGRTKDNRLSETLQGATAAERAKTPADTSLEDILLAVDWDVVMIQEASVVAPFFNKGTNEWTGVHTPEPFRDYETGTVRISYGDPLKNYVAYLKAKAPHAELWWHQTWALHPETTCIDLGTDAKRDGMYDALNTNAEWVAQTYGAKIMPTGYAVQLYRYQLPVTQRSQDPCSFDTRHINGGYYVYGSNQIPAEQRYRTYLQMMTWCQRFYGKMPAAGATDYEPSVAAEKTLMRSCALQAANATSYRDYGQSVTPVDPPEDDPEENDPVTSPITLTSPANGSTLALYTTNQKKFFNLTYPAIKTQYTGFDASMTNKYLRIRPTFTWSGASGAVTVTVTRQADGAVLQTTSLASGKTSCSVRNLEVATAYRWTVTDAQGHTSSATFTTEGQAPRILYSTKVPSIRDLGGWVGLQGCRVRSGQMFRTAEMNNSGSACRLTDDERNFYLNVIGMRTEVDFRASSEVTGLAAASPIGDAVTYVRYPIKPYLLGTFEEGEDKPYGWMRLSFDKAFNAETRPMIFHCKIGRDRTGTFAALTFALLGVSEDDIYREYRIAGDFPTSDAFQIDQFVTLLKTTYPADTLAASAKRYFTEALGYTAAEVEQFRSEMLVGYVPEGGSSLALSAPANGATVAFFTSGQKNFFALSGDAIKTSYTGFDSSMIDPMLRQGVNLAWTGASGALTLTVRRVADSQALVSASLPAGTTSYVAHNLELGTEYRWTVTDAQGGTASRTFTTETQSPRILYSAQVPSMRDLGGWTGLQGCRVKQNELFRTGQMDAPSSGNLLTAAEQDFLANTLGIKTDIDFRYSSETEGLSGSPIGSGVTYCQYPIEPYALGTFSKTEDNPYGYMRLSFRKAFDASARPLIFHCKHGRDRTGTFAAITLALLGVSEDDICREYRVAGDMPQGGGKYQIDTLLPLLTTGYPAESLAASAKRYFVETLNFTDAEVEQFRSELLVGYVKPTDPEDPTDPDDPTQYGEPDASAATYTWKGGNGPWTFTTNWAASAGATYGIPNNATYATAVFPASATASFVCTLAQSASAFVVDGLSQNGTLILDNATLTAAGPAKTGYRAFRLGDAATGSAAVVLRGTNAGLVVSRSSAYGSFGSESSATATGTMTVRYEVPATPWTEAPVRTTAADSKIRFYGNVRFEVDATAVAVPAPGETLRIPLARGTAVGDDNVTPEGVVFANTTFDAVKARSAVTPASGTTAELVYENALLYLDVTASGTPQPPAKTVYYFVGKDEANKSSFASSTAGAAYGWATNGTVLTHTVAAGNDYVIPSGTVLRTSSSADFKGDALTLAGTILLKGKPLTLGFPSLVADGGSLMAGDSKQSVTLNGAITIPEGRSLTFAMLRSDSTAATVTTLAAKLTGAGTLSVGGATVTAVSSVAQTLVLSDAGDFAGTLSAAVLPCAQNFVLKVTGGFGGAVAALPAGTTKAVFNYAELDGAKGVRIAATTVPNGLATGLVLYGVADTTAANLPLMTFPAGTVLDPTAFTVSHAATVDGVATAFANLGVIANADGTQTLAANVSSGGSVAVDGEAVTFDAATFTDTDKVNSQKTVVFATQPTVGVPTEAGTSVTFGGKTVVMQPYYDVSFTATAGGYKMELALNETATPAIADEAETPAIAVTEADVNVHVANREAGLWYALGAADAPNPPADVWQVGTYVKGADPTAVRTSGETQKFYKVFVRDSEPVK